MAYPESLAASPNGQSLYVVNRSGSDLLLQYTVQADGSLTPKSPPGVAPTGFSPEDVAVSPDSRSVYVTNDGGTVSQYTAAADGTLSPKSPATVPTGSGDESAEPFGVAVSPNGNSVYVANFEAFINLNGSISQFSVGAGGTLSPKSPPSVVAAGHLEDLVVSPDGRNVYATNLNPPNTMPGTVVQYSVGMDGTLAPKSPPAVAAGFAPFGIAISGDGKNVYAADEGSAAISQYSVGADGALSPRSPATVPAEGAPYQIFVTPLRTPTSKDQCKNGRWRNYPQFKNQGQCVAFVVKQARQKCLAERAKIGLVAFRNKYGLGRYHVLALRRCVNRASR